MKYNKSASEQKTGRVVRKMDDKGFGFITHDRIDYFFHRSQCVTPFENLEANDEVTFDVEDSGKGPRAVNVERV